MRQFIYKHHKLSVAIIHIFALLLAVGGICLAIILSPGEDLNTEGALSMVLGLGLALLIEIGAVNIPPYKYAMAQLMRLGRLSYGRSCFSSGASMSPSAKHSEISARLEARGMTERIARCGEGLVGRWTKLEAIIGEKNITGYTNYSTNFYLYSVEKLDTGVWQGIKNDLSVRLLEDREEQKDKKETIGIVNSVCVLADSVDAEVIKAARGALSIKLTDTLTLSGIRVCVCEPANDRYYLSAERTAGENNRTNKSLEVLARGIFGVGLGKLGKLGVGYTDEYLQLLDKACNTPLSELWSEEKSKKEKEAAELAAEQELMRCAEGEIIRRGDVLRCVDGGIEIDSWIMLVDEALRSFEDEDYGDAEDMFCELDEMAEDEPENDELTPIVPEDYRGPIVLCTQGFGTKVNGGGFRFIGKRRREAVFSRVRVYLLEEGFEEVYYYNEKRKTIDKT